MAETPMDVESSEGHVAVVPSVSDTAGDAAVDIQVDAAPTAADGTTNGDVQEEMPFTDEELAVFFKVLDTLASKTALLDQSNMRTLRKHLAPVADYMEGRKFGGKGRKKYLEDKQLREEKRARHNQKKMHDKRHINSSLLRRERIKKLESLLEQGKDAGLPMIADGVAGEDVVHHTSALQSLCNDEAAQAKEEQDAETKREASALLGFRSCYTCKARFEKIHHFYDQLCPRCAELNFSKRFQTSDLRGKVALITGARVKIGFQSAVKLLLAGAAVIATTRFPTDAAERFAQHPEYETFKDRLQIFGIDFRDLVHLEQFMDFVLTRYSRLDIIIHNACQTIRRPPKYYEHLVQKEMLSLEQSPKNVQLLMHHQQEFQSHVKSVAIESGAATDATATSTAAASFAMSSALKSQVPLIASDEQDASAFPEGLVDVNGQQLDLRSKNTWLLKIGEVATPEVAEVFAINTLAPFIMNNRLVPLLERNAGPNDRKFIVNVSAMEGKFYRYKTPNHPHTNMAKAALNMMTRTCAEDLSKRRIYMNSVDTGWINDENPLEKAHAHAMNSNFQTPIDEIDAAARILDPVFVGYNALDQKAMFGKFLKDFHETEW
uniref:Oxidoreductase n=1 Tax=Globisporangium ultimum (strain ATCC 200006 / CBS 805.95 / DAOM BR144) TaxID=431595 RepID=K3WUJ8_GLOUD